MALGFLFHSVDHLGFLFHTGDESKGDVTAANSSEDVFASRRGVREASKYGFLEGNYM